MDKVITLNELRDMLRGVRSMDDFLERCAGCGPLFLKTGFGG